MKIEKKLMIMIIGLSLAGAGILGEIFLQISKGEVQEITAKDAARPVEENSGRVKQDADGPRSLMAGIPWWTAGGSAYGLLIISAAIGGLVVIFITAAAFVTTYGKAGNKEAGAGTILPPDTTGNKNEICSIKQAAINISNLNREIARQAESISQSTASIKQALVRIRAITQTPPHNSGGRILLNGPKGETFNHITLTKQIQDEYGDRN